MLSQKTTFPRLPCQVWPHDILTSEMLTDMGQEVRTRHFQEGSKRSWRCWEVALFTISILPLFYAACAMSRNRGRGGQEAGEDQIKKGLKHRAKEFDICPLLASNINDTCHPLWKHWTIWFFFLRWGRWQSEILFAFRLPKQMESDAFYFKYPFSGLFVFHLRRL